MKSHFFCIYTMYMDEYLLPYHYKGHKENSTCTGIIMDMGSANKRLCYNVTLSLISWAQTYNDLCLLITVVQNTTQNWQRYSIEKNFDLMGGTPFTNMDQL